MRPRTLVAATAVVCLLSPAAMTPATASHATGQEVKQTIVAPPLPAKNVSRGGRSLVIISRMLGVNGVGGYYFEPKPETLGAPFVLSPVGKQDVDVFFYEDLGDLTTAPAVIVGEHTAETTTGESGFVPPTTKLVVIYYGTCADCVSSGAPPAAVSFEYRAQTTPLVTIADGVTDLGRTEVHAGGSVFFDNQTAAPVSLRSQGGTASTPLFGSDGEFTGKSLVSVGDLKPGEYAYTVSNGATGVLVVV